MGDQRVEARPALGLEDAGDGRAIGGVAGQPVDGLGRDRDDLAGLEQASARSIASPMFRIFATVASMSCRACL